MAEQIISRSMKLDEIAKLTGSIDYITTAPSSDNPVPGNLKFVVLTGEPAVLYNGYYYIIVEE